MNDDIQPVGIPQQPVWWPVDATAADVSAYRAAQALRDAMTDFDDRTTAQIEESLRASLTTIRRCWVLPDAPKGTGGGRKRAPGSAAPGGAASVRRTSLAHTLALWLQATQEPDDGITIDMPEKKPGDTPTDLGDPMQTSAILLANAALLSGWQYASRMADELHQAARDIAELTRVPPDGVHIGNCPHEIVMTDDTRRECEAPIYATKRTASDVKCPRCGRGGTVEQWQEWILGAAGDVQVHELCKKLAATGLRRSTPNGLRMLAKRNVIPGPKEKDGVWLWDAEAVMRALIARESNMPA